jgi:hypothetical protein
VRALRRGEPPPYATARLAGVLPGEPEPTEGSRVRTGRPSFGDLPTVVPGARPQALPSLSEGPPSTSSSTLVSVLSNESAVMDRPAAPVQVTNAPALPAAPVASPSNGYSAATDAQAGAAPAFTAGTNTTLGTGKLPGRPAARTRPTQILLFVLLAAIVVLAMVATGIWWYFRNTIGDHAALQWTPRLISSCHVAVSRRA